MRKDVVQVLLEDHAVLGWLAERLRPVSSSSAGTPMFNEFARALGAHQTVIDQTVIPALKACGWRGLSSDVLTGHMALKRSFAELLTLRADSPDFEPSLSALMRQLTRHCELEDRKLLPLLTECLSESQREILAFEAEAHLTQILGDMPMQDADLAQPATALLEEAQLVLSSLPSTRQVEPTPS
jgi:hypothetical protein